MLDIYPAIDLKDGAAVRLFKGQMESAKIYGAPLDFALRFEKMGAKWLHIVDLNGAFAGEPKNLESVREICAKTRLSIELGGGVRDEAAIARYAELGVARVILGSVALKNPAFVKEMAKKYRVAVGIDARGGKVAVEGWAKSGEMEAAELARAFKDTGVEAIISTDIERDGALSGINEAFTAQIAQNSGIYTIASGGFASVSELDALSANPHISGLIIGKAFYEGRVDLESVIKRFGD